jgi:hypothetical protein
MAIPTTEICSCVDYYTADERNSRLATLELLCGILNAILTGGAAPEPAIIDGYTDTVTTISPLTITFSDPVNTVSLYSSSALITEVAVMYSPPPGGLSNGLQYIPPGGSIDIGLKGANRITAVTFTNQASNYQVIANGVYTGV